MEDHYAELATKKFSDEDFKIIAVVLNAVLTGLTEIDKKTSADTRKAILEQIDNLLYNLPKLKELLTEDK